MAEHAKEDSVPERIQLKRTTGWRLPPGAVSVARPTKWGNPFGYRQRTGLPRPAARQPSATATGSTRAGSVRHDYHHPDGQVTVCHVRYMTRAEIIETYRRPLTGDLTPSMRLASPGGRFMQVTVDDVRRELAGRDLACWCPLPAPGEPDSLPCRRPARNRQPVHHELEGNSMLDSFADDITTMACWARDHNDGHLKDVQWVFRAAELQFHNSL
jgi:hypothetical protein